LRLWKTNKDEFVRLVQNESPEQVEEILGIGRYDIAKELADETLGVLRQQANKRMTQLSVQSQITEGQKAVAELIKQNTSIMRLPSFINFFAAAGNRALSEYEKALGVKTMNILTQAMKNPQDMADLLKALPKEERNRVTELLLNPNTIRTLSPSTNKE